MPVREGGCLGVWTDTSIVYINYVSTSAKDITPLSLSDFLRYGLHLPPGIHHLAAQDGEVLPGQPHPFLVSPTESQGGWRLSLQCIDPSTVYYNKTCRTEKSSNDSGMEQGKMSAFRTIKRSQYLLRIGNYSIYTPKHIHRIANNFINQI